MENSTIIIPVHKLTEELSNYLSIALNSIAIQKNKPKEIIIVLKNDETLLKDLEKLIQDKQFKEILNIEIVLNDGKTDYCSQINLGVDKTKTEWFSVLNMDDYYSPKYFKSFEEYKTSYPDVDIFIPVIKDVSFKDNTFLGFTNEAVWASGFSDDEISILTNNTALDVPIFSFDGAFIKVKDFKEVGGLKSNIIYSFSYEFILRATAKPLKVMVIPKIGYVRVNGREDSLISNYEKTLTNEEKKFWRSTAKKEYLFKEDREINTNFLNDLK